MRKVTGGWEKARYRTVNKIMCPTEGGYPLGGLKKDCSDIAKVC